jgi:type IV pilus assembly protein PilV
MNVRKLQSGFGLMEVLVALLILSIGLLGIASLQLTALKNVGSSMERSQAVIQTYSYLEVLRANVKDDKPSALDVPLTCAESQLESSKEVQRKWIRELKASLGPQACGKAECLGRQCTITIQWDDSRAEGGSTTQQLVTETAL